MKYDSFFISLKEMHNSFKRWPLNLWQISNKTIIEVLNITKAATFKSFLHKSYKKHKITFFVTVLFNFFIRQTLTDDFWGLHENMNCMFPLSEFLPFNTKYHKCADWLFSLKTFLLLWKYVYQVLFSYKFVWYSCSAWIFKQ